jgi:hypothetical protein
MDAVSISEPTHFLSLSLSLSTLCVFMKVKRNWSKHFFQYFECRLLRKLREERKLEHGKKKN